MLDNFVVLIDKLIAEGKSVPVTIIPEILETIHVFEDGSSTEALAIKSIGKSGLIQQNAYDPLLLYNIKVVGEPDYFEDLIPYRRQRGWVLEKEMYNNDTIIVVNSLKGVKLRSNETKNR